MSLFVYLSELPLLTDESSASIMVDEIFGARLFQEQNFEELVKSAFTKTFDFSKITNLKNNFEALQNKVIVSRCYFFENEFFLKTFFIDLNIEYISNKN